jgi:hypothetical protein
VQEIGRRRPRLGADLRAPTPDDIGTRSRDRRTAAEWRRPRTFMTGSYGARTRAATGRGERFSGRRMGGLAGGSVGVRNRTEERTLLECCGKPSSRTRPAAPTGVPSRTSRGLAAAASWGFPQLRKFLSWPAAAGGSSGVRSAPERDRRGAGALLLIGGPSTTTSRSGLSCPPK